MTVVTNKQKAQSQAFALAVSQLRERGYNIPTSLRVFGRNLLVTPPSFDVTIEGTDELVRPADQIVALHYLLSKASKEPTGELISFREFPGGAFYLEPFRSRTVVPLVKHFGNDLDALRQALNHFDWIPAAAGDLGATVQTIGKLTLTLVYYRGEEGFDPSAEVLFDSSIRRVFCTEDATVLATRLCRGLINKQCVPCSACGMCDTRTTNES